jgi:hypothetical protein
MEASVKVQDPADHLQVALTALKGLVDHIRVTDGEEFSDVEVYINVYPSTGRQFAAVLEACDNAGIAIALDVQNDRVRGMCGPTPGPPVTVWGEDVTAQEKAA